MAFCQNCGKKLDDGAKFCPECGTPVGQKDMSKRNQEYGGKIIKCPNCGEILKAFSAQCPSCGYELRGSDSSDSVKEFVRELENIEEERKKADKDAKKNKLAKTFGANDSHRIDQLLANKISNFAVPNTKEDIFEFMILAVSNIDPMSHNTLDEGYSPSEREGKLMISNAWDSKYNQVYQKARMLFPEDPRLIEIENLYKRKLQQIEKEESKSTKLVLMVLPFVLILIALIIVFK